MWLGIACLVVATGTAGGAYLYFHESVAAVAAKTPEVKQGRAAARRRAPGPAGGRARDRLRPPQGRTGRTRALGHAHARPRRPGHRLDLAPLVPARHARRDPLPWPDAVLRQDQRRLRELRAAGLAADGQGARPGVQINYLITVNFRGFRQIVDRLDGAWIDVDRRYFNDRGGPCGYATINLRPGYQQLTGRQALDYVRYRHTDSDLYRVARQQQFVKAFKGQIQESFAPIALPKVVNAITNNVEVAQGGGSRRRRAHGPLVRALRVRPAARARVPDADRGPRGLRRPDDRLREHHARDPDVHAPRRRVVGEGDRRRARREAEAARAGSARDDDHGAERERRHRLRVDRRATSSASAATRS